MQVKNTNDKYGIIAISFHWLIALLVFFQLVVGVYMMEFLGFSPLQIKLFGTHKEFGVLVLILAILRLSWRLMEITPTLPGYMPRWQHFAAKTAHFLLYAFLFALPLTGWLMSSAGGFPVSFFGLFILPDLIGPDMALQDFFISLHFWLAIGFVAVIGTHVMGAISHLVLYKENLIKRMLP